MNIITYNNIKYQFKICQVYQIVSIVENIKNNRMLCGFNKIGKVNQKVKIFGKIWVKLDIFMNKKMQNYKKMSLINIRLYQLKK